MSLNQPANASGERSLVIIATPPEKRQLTSVFIPPMWSKSSSRMLVNLLLAAFTSSLPSACQGHAKIALEVPVLPA